MIGRGIVKPVSVFKMSIRHTELPCPLVHTGYKGALAPAHVLGKRNRGIVCGGDHYALYKILDRHLLALF